MFLTGLEDAVFPHLRALSDPAELAEERRLAYVGITRARERLYLSRALPAARGARRSGIAPSRFLDEIPGELVEWTGAVDRQPFVPVLRRRRAEPLRRPRLPCVGPRRSAQEQLAASRLAGGRGLRGGAGNRADPGAERRRPGHPRRVGARHRRRHPRHRRAGAGADRLRHAGRSGWCCATRRSRSSDRGVCGAAGDRSRRLLWILCRRAGDSAVIARGSAQDRRTGDPAWSERLIREQ